PPGNHRRHLKKIAAIISLATSALLLLFILACNIWIVSATRPEVFSDIRSLPVNRDGLVLATGKRIERGRINQHFLRRVDAATALYRAGKVQRLILSGDKAHDEPMELKRALLDRGVPESALILDNYGLRTLDSVVRARDVFHCGNLTIISERFHEFRALFLSRYYGINAIAFAPPDLPFRWMIRSTLRESLARVKAVLDLYLLHTKPTVASAWVITLADPSSPALSPWLTLNEVLVELG
ncbi:MAG: vancomycin high temperature exclusion protein, partial [Verrucomicrobiia bacterium]